MSVVSSSRIRTAAESALIDAFGAKFGALPGDHHVVTARDNAVEALKEFGLPTRRIESWHYTDLRTLMRTIPLGETGPGKLPPPLVAGSHVLPLDDGAALGGKAGGGVAISRISGKLEDGSFAKALVSRGTDDAIGLINIAFVTDGYHLDIADNVSVEKPIEIQFEANQASHTRFAIKVGKGAKATIIERHFGADAFVSAITHMVLEDGAEIVHIIDQERANDATHLGQFNATIGKDAKLTLFVMNTGGKLVRQEIHVEVKGEGSDFKLRAINLVGGDSHVDVTMTLAHEVANTTSTEIIRNVITAHAQGVFQGQIRVLPGAQKTDAKMACNTLLLSDEAGFSTKPELEIFADDVQCGHGATVREVEPQHLFYLMARGIPEATARGLLVKAFVAEIIEELENEELVEALETRLADWLEVNA
jgi:Fe-S cluster assembly protein SufD